MMLVPFAATALQEALRERPPVSRLERSSVFAGAVVCLAVLALIVPADGRPARRRRTRTGCPTLDDLPAGTAVLNDWGEGGYLMWRFPELNFVMNGYGDIFTDDEIARNYRDGRAPTPAGSQSVKGTGAQYALLRTGSRLAYGLDGSRAGTVTAAQRHARAARGP